MTASTALALAPNTIVRVTLPGGRPPILGRFVQQDDQGRYLNIDFGGPRPGRIAAGFVQVDD